MYYVKFKRVHKSAASNNYYSTKVSVYALIIQKRHHESTQVALIILPDGRSCYVPNFVSDILVNVVRTIIPLISISFSSLVLIFVLVLVSPTIIQNVFVIFTARRYASAVLAVIVCLSVRLSVRPSVRLSVTSRSCTKTAKCRITLTTPYDSPGTLVFRRRKSRRNSNNNTPNGGRQIEVR